MLQKWVKKPCSEKYSQRCLEAKTSFIQTTIPSKGLNLFQPLSNRMPKYFLIWILKCFVEKYLPVNVLILSADATLGIFLFNQYPSLYDCSSLCACVCSRTAKFYAINDCIRMLLFSGTTTNVLVKWKLRHFMLHVQWYWERNGVSVYSAKLLELGHYFNIHFKLWVAWNSHKKLMLRKCEAS